jgi:hypothetical protein
LGERASASTAGNPRYGIEHSETIVVDRDAHSTIAYSYCPESVQLNPRRRPALCGQPLDGG